MAINANGNCTTSSRAVLNCRLADLPNNIASGLTPANIRSPSVPSSFSSVIAVARKLTAASTIKAKFSHRMLLKKNRPGAPSERLRTWAMTRLPRISPAKSIRNR